MNKRAIFFLIISIYFIYSNASANDELDCNNVYTSPKYIPLNEMGHLTLPTEREYGAIKNGENENVIGYTYEINDDSNKILHVYNHESRFHFFMIDKNSFHLGNDLMIKPNEILYGKVNSETNEFNHGIKYDVLNGITYIGNFKVDLAAGLLYEQSSYFPYNLESGMVFKKGSYVSRVKDETVEVLDSSKINYTHKLSAKQTEKLGLDTHLLSYKYIGDTEEGIPDGYGYIFQNGTTYFGEIRNGLPHGIGKEDGPMHSFIGEFVDGLSTRGYLRTNDMQYQAVSHYIGEIHTDYSIKHSLYSGFSFLIHNTNFPVEEYLPKIGETIGETSSLGSDYLPVLSIKDLNMSPIYFGEFSSHEHITGTMYWPDGSVYTGEFGWGGEQDGFGVFLAANGNKSIGFFKDGIRHGRVALVRKDEGMKWHTFCKGQIINE